MGRYHGESKICPILQIMNQVVMLPEKIDRNQAMDRLPLTFLTSTMFKKVFLILEKGI